MVCALMVVGYQDMFHRLQCGAELGVQLFLCHTCMHPHVDKTAQKHASTCSYSEDR